jgi:hypothetical protein
VDDLLAALRNHTLLFASPVIDPGVQVALVGGIFTLGGIALSVLLDRGSKRRRAPVSEADEPDDHDELLAELRRANTTCEQRAERYRAERDRALHSTMEVMVRERRLREFVAALGYNPDTLRRRAPAARVEDDER